MEKISKKEAIQALSDHYEIPVDTILSFVRNESKTNKTTGKYLVRTYLSPKDANAAMEKAELYGWKWKPISIATKGDGGMICILFEKGG